MNGKLFCRHFYKDTKQETLQTGFEFEDYTGDRLDWKVVAAHQTCIKCGRERLIKKKVYCYH